MKSKLGLDLEQEYFRRLWYHVQFISSSFMISSSHGTFCSIIAACKLQLNVKKLSVKKLWYGSTNYDCLAAMCKSNAGSGERKAMSFSSTSIRRRAFGWRKSIGTTSLQQLQQIGTLRPRLSVKVLIASRYVKDPLMGVSATKATRRQCHIADLVSLSGGNKTSFKSLQKLLLQKKRHCGLILLVAGSHE